MSIENNSELIPEEILRFDENREKEKIMLKEEIELIETELKEN